MPILTFTNSNTLFGGVLNSRVLIGRRLSHGVVLSDPSVSRLHAWIDPVADENAGWVLVDAGSKSGTFVNNQQIARHRLRDGDEIRVGTVTLHYREQDTLPHGVKPVELRAPSGVVKTSGILFECNCGAPLWVGSDLAGKRGMCRHCHQPVTVPVPAVEPAVIVKPMPTPAPAAARAAKPSSSKHALQCAVCHSAILDGEQTKQCPDCAMNFHAECWEENFGCSSYGCPQVNVLQPAAASEVKTAPSESIEAPRTTPWEPILLAASIISSFLGAPAFGGLAVIVAVIAIIMLIRGKSMRTGMLIAALLFSVLGIATGLGVSDFMYFGARHWPAVLRQYLQ